MPPSAQEEFLRLIPSGTFLHDPCRRLLPGIQQQRAQDSHAKAAAGGRGYRDAAVDTGDEPTLLFGTALPVGKLPHLTAD